MKKQFIQQLLHKKLFENEQNEYNIQIPPEVIEKFQRKAETDFNEQESDIQTHQHIINNIIEFKTKGTINGKKLEKEIDPTTFDNVLEYEQRTLQILLNNRRTKEQHFETLVHYYIKDEEYKIREEKRREEVLQQKLTSENIIDIFVTALEGGSNYWYYIKIVPEDVKYKVKHKNLALSEAIGQYILEGGSIYFYDVEGDEDEEPLGKVNMDSILEAISLTKKDYPDVWFNILDEQADAGDADVFLQLCVMGEVVFG